MPDRLIPARELLAWLCCFLIVSALLVSTGFTSQDADSGLYAGLADRLAHEPVSRWLAPEWWGFWPDAHMTGLFREHPAGVLLLPAAMSKIGIPPLQGAYVVGLGTGLASLLLMGGLIRRFASLESARIALVLLQLMPVAFIFRVRANHEYPMLVCLLLAVHGLVAASMGRLPLASMLLALGLAGGLVIKGVFVAKVLLAVAIWIAVDPLPSAGSRRRCAVAALAGVAAMIAIAIAYETGHRSATGLPFWSLYWERQLGPLTDVTAADAAISFGRNLVFYLSRIMWHPAPWSFALLLALWRFRGGSTGTWRGLSDSQRRAAIFTVSFAIIAILLVAPVSRYAERYAFPSSHAIACAGVVAVGWVWPTIAANVTRLDRAIPMLPAILWLTLALLRLGGGSLLPRFS